MCSARSPVKGRTSARTLPPNRYLFEGAATPFIVHGHRLSSLYRGTMTPQIPFIVLKILKKLCGPSLVGFEYLRNNEALWGWRHA